MLHLRRIRRNPPRLPCYLPFGSHPNYQSRYDCEMNGDITSTGEVLSTKHSSKKDIERYKEAQQRKREQMAKDK